VIIIAEAGVNHNGNFELAKDLAVKAKETGADYVKYQSFITESNITMEAPKAVYQTETTDIHETQFEMLKKLEFSLSETKELKQFCDSIKMGFLTTPAENENIELVEEMKLDFIKIASESIVNYQLLEKVGSLKGKIIMSTGMSTIDEIDAALKVLIESGTNRQNIILLHCNSQYPTLFKDVNLRAMATLKKHFCLQVGLSDHSMGLEVPISAAARGACIIEKHFTLDNDMEGPDHKCSLNPDDFTRMVSMIRNLELALGTGEKTPTESEKKNIHFMRRSLVAKVSINKGELFTAENLIAKRPGTGLSPMLWPSVIGERAVKFFNKDDFITLK
jgi:N,N'-diacetyllegionaminate synthase